MTCHQVRLCYSCLGLTARSGPLDWKTAALPRLLNRWPSGTETLWKHPRPELRQERPLSEA